VQCGSAQFFSDGVLNSFKNWLLCCFIKDAMRISKSFLKRSLIYTVAGTLPMASAIILLPFYVAYLSTSDFGALSIYLAFSLFIQILTTYSFDTSLYIHFHEYKNDRGRLSSFVSSAFILMLGIGMVVGLVFTVCGNLVFNNLFSDRSISFHPYGFLAAVAGIFQALFKVHSNLLQSREKPNVYLWSNIGSFSLIAVFTIIGLHLYPGSLVGPVGGRLVAAVFSGLWALTRMFREFGIHFNYPLLRTSFSFNLYTFIYQLLQWIINYFDRIIMVFFLALSDVGVYDFAIKCLLIIEFLLSGIHSAFYPKIVSMVMAQTNKGSTPEINRYYHGFTSVNLLLICLGILTLPWAVETFVEKASYRESIQYFPFIALIYIFRSMRQFFLAPYGILKYTKPLPVIYLLVSAIKVSIILLLVNRFAIYSVIVASLVSAMVEIVLLYFNVREKFHFQYNVFKIVIVPVVIFMLILTLEPLFAGKAPVLIHGFYVFICVILLWWVYRKEIGLIDPFNMLR
jgi:O-antigen/teichoic acid export membrane protein